jgi:glutamate dehydrogenase (NAD(P)+)
MVQNAYQYYWDEETADQRLEHIMTEAFHKVHETALQRSVNNRVAAYLIAVSRVGQAVRLRGWV